MSNSRIMDNRFKVLTVNLATGKGELDRLDKREEWIGGSGLAAALFQKYARADKPWDDPDQPLIFAVGPLTGYFPLMSKTVCAFKSPYHDQYAESHAGGRSAMALKLSGLDALVIKGKAPNLSCLIVGSRMLKLTNVDFLKGYGAFQTGKMLRRTGGTSGIRSILRIGPAGENRSAMACINVDSYRHFGRLGSGGVMGDKNLKGIIIEGDADLPTPSGKTYKELFADVYEKVTATDMMSKYHNLGTAANINGLNRLRALPFRNLQQTSDPKAEEIGGEAFARDSLLRNAACAGCPVGCIHIGFVREMFTEQNRYRYMQVAYDYEPIFSLGSMIGLTDRSQVLQVMDEVERQGFDAMGAGVALAWATEARDKDLISQRETIVPLKFGDVESYRNSLKFFGAAENEFYSLLSQGTLKATQKYGGTDFACVLGQEMAGYATGEVSYLSQALGLRHSHLDTGGYSYDQKSDDKVPVDEVMDFIIRDEQARVMLTSMVSCLFARSVYGDDLIKEALNVMDMGGLADNLDQAVVDMTDLRWKVRLDTGYDPGKIEVPKRLFEVENWKGNPDSGYYDQLRIAYCDYIKSKA